MARFTFAARISIASRNEPPRSARQGGRFQDKRVLMRGAILRRPSSGAVVAQRYGVVQWQASAVGIDRLAGDVGRVVACEKHGDGRDLLRIAETARAAFATRWCAPCPSASKAWLLAVETTSIEHSGSRSGPPGLRGPVVWSSSTLTPLPVGIVSGSGGTGLGFPAGDIPGGRELAPRFVASSGRWHKTVGVRRESTRSSRSSGSSSPRSLCLGICRGAQRSPTN